MTWLLPLACALVGLCALAWFAARLAREIGPTSRALDRFGRDLRPVLLRVRDETARTRRRYDG